MRFTNSFAGKYKLVERPGESHEGVGRKKNAEKASKIQPLTVLLRLTFAFYIIYKSTNAKLKIANTRAFIYYFFSCWNNLVRVVLNPSMLLGSISLDDGYHPNKVIRGNQSPPYPLIEVSDFQQEKRCSRTRQLPRNSSIKRNQARRWTVHPKF